jgi:hypothetical protein
MHTRQSIIPEIKPDPPSHVLAIRCLAVVTASIALGGFIVWYGLGGNETYPEMAESVARHNSDQRYLFSETSHGVYVALPPRAPTGSPASGSASSVATAAATTPPLPRAKPLQMHAMSTTPVQEQQRWPIETKTDAAPPTTEAETDQSTAADSSRDAAYQPDSTEAVHEPSTLDDQRSTQQTQDEGDEPSPGEPTSATSDDETWQTSAPTESEEEPSWDESSPEEPADPPESDPPT